MVDVSIKMKIIFGFGVGESLRCNGRGRNTGRIPRKSKTPEGARRQRKAPREEKDSGRTCKETS